MNIDDCNRRNTKKTWRMTRLQILIGLVLALTLIAVGFGVGYAVAPRTDSSSADNNLITITSTKATTSSPNFCRPNSTSFSRAAVAADAEQCSKIGCDILLRGGTAADAAVGTLLCIGLANMHSSGVGGGSFALYYDKTSATPTFLDFREVAPMYPNVSIYENGTTTIYGPLAIAVPGEVKGLRELWKRYGRLNWAELVEPAVQMAQKGYAITKPLEDAIKVELNVIRNNSFLSKILLNNGKPRQAGEIIKNELLATTLAKIRDDPDSFYTGDLANAIAEDIRLSGGVLTLEDLQKYTVKERKVFRSSFNGYKILTTSSPSSGGILAMILNIVEACRVANYSSYGDNNQVAHRIVEAFKWSYAVRSLIGDPDFQNLTFYNSLEKKMLDPQTAAEICQNKIKPSSTQTSYLNFTEFFSEQDHGTTHVSIVDMNGNAISVTSSINTRFGSGFTSNSTGILFNNHMDDFSDPYRANFYGLKPSPSNFILPRKTPQSSMCPTIILDQNGKVTMVVGASGGTRITTAVAQVIINRLMFNFSLQDAVKAPRLHHQLTPYQVVFEATNRIQESVIAYLKKIGNKVVNSTAFAACQAVFQHDDGRIDAETDPRKPSRAYGF